jgi:hypothetical protein
MQPSDADTVSFFEEACPGSAFGNRADDFMAWSHRTFVRRQIALGHV